MSRITELVEAEAAKAEAEEDEEEAEAAESEPEPEEEDEEEDEEPEARMPTDAERRAFERELTRHEKAVAKFVGADWKHYKACDLCGGVGFVPEQVEPPPEVMRDPDAIVCDACNGWGRRLTGSLAEGNESIPCTVCGGAGWRDRRAAYAQQQVAAPPQGAVPAASPAAGYLPDRSAAIAALEAQGYVVVAPVTPPAPGAS